MEMPPSSTHRRLRSLAIGTGVLIALVGALALVSKVRRPEILSSGSIAFALCILSIFVYILLFFSSLRTDAEWKIFSPRWIDVLYAAAVAVSLISFLVASRSRENFLQPFMLITGFAVYLLVRTGRRRFRGAPAMFLAAALVALAGIEAAHGLAQGAFGREMKGFFFNVNHFAMFLAMVVPVAWAVSRLGKNKLLRVSGYGVSALMLTAIGLSRCRTAYTALILVAGVAFLLGRLPRTAPGGREPRPWLSAVRAALAFGAAGPDRRLGPGGLVQADVRRGPPRDLEGLAPDGPRASRRRYRIRELPGRLRRRTGTLFRRREGDRDRAALGVGGILRLQRLSRILRGIGRDRARLSAPVLGARPESGRGRVPPWQVPVDGARDRLRTSAWPSARRAPFWPI